MTVHRARWILMTGLLGAVLTFAACGGSDNSSGSSNATATPSATPTPAGGGGGGGAQLSLAAPADGSLKFDKKELKAKAGAVTINFDNPSGTPHAVNVEGNGIQEKGTATVTKGEASVTLENLKPGTYEFYCPVDGHRQAGMEGTLTVS
jgi:plastocyanin